MKKEIRTIVHDEGLQIDAYRFEGIIQPFPNHFHDYYVIGFIEKGERCLTCKEKEYMIKKGNILLFNPGDNHACVQVENESLNYWGLNISKEIMQSLVEKIAGQRGLLGFYKNVIYDEVILYYLRLLHEMIVSSGDEFGKEENLLLLLTHLIQKYGYFVGEDFPVCREEIKKACIFMKQHYMEPICLEQICKQVRLSKSTLLRAFTKAKGVSPYLYLQNIRIGEAKKLLEQGVAPIDVALQTGFFDQSHFTNYFTSFIGLLPSSYRDSLVKKEQGETKHGE